MIQSETIKWAMNVLKQPQINTTVVVQTAWSTVLKISTHQGSVYLKQTPPDLFIEVDIIQKCRELCGITDIPEVITANKNLYCFLMKECGDASLRTVFDGHLDAINLPFNADNPISVKQHEKIHKGFIWLIANMQAEL